MRTPENSQAESKPRPVATVRATGIASNMPSRETLESALRILTEHKPPAALQAIVARMVAADVLALGAA